MNKDSIISASPDYKAYLTIAVFLAAALFTAELSFFFLALLPSLIFFYSAIVGKFKISLSFFIPFFLLVVISNALNLRLPYIYAFTMGLVGIIIAEITEHKTTIEKVIAYPVLIIIILTASYFILFGMQKGENPWHWAQRLVTNEINETWNRLLQFPWAKEDIEALKNNELYFKTFFLNIVPALAVCGTIFIVWLNVLTGKFFLKKRGIIFPPLETLALWKAPQILIWFFIVAGGAYFIPQENISFISLNIFIISLFIYVFQGFAIISFLFQNKNVPAFFRFLFYIFIAVEPFLMIAIAAIGLFDLWIDFRRFFTRKKDDPDQEIF